ncbi:MAG: polyketide cyclase / dehydrase and lipid transport [Jiangellales bacterium]
MAPIDIVDETYVAVEPSLLAPGLTNPSLLRDWFPRLRFEVFMDRAEKGTRWSVAGEIDGSMEVWLEPVAAGTVVHWFVRGEFAGRRDLTRQYLETLNARMFLFKDTAEKDRRAP